jgi:uncharacterized protein (DUF849 family)
MALAIKDAGVTPELEVFETGHLLLAKRFLENGYVKGPGVRVPRHLLGPAGGPRNHDLYAKPVAAGCTGSPSAIPVPDGGAGGCSAAIRASGWRTTSIWKGKLAPSNAALVEKPARSSRFLGDEVATPADARQS